MRRAVEVPYWIVVGVLTIVGIYFSVLYNLPPYFLLAALVMAVVGAWWPGPQYSWAALAGFGWLPALLLSVNLVGQLSRADWSCSEISFQPGPTIGYQGPSGEMEYCATIPGQLIVIVAAFWAIALLGTAALVYVVLRRRRPQADARVTPLGLMGLGVVLLLVVGATASYVVVKEPLTPEERADLPPDQPPLPPLSCPPEAPKEEIAAFEGSGDRVTPAFEVTDYWGYLYAVSGSGNLRMRVLDKDGNEVSGSEESVPTNSVGSTELASGGTFKLDIDADGDVKYAVVVCEGGWPEDKDRGSRATNSQTTVANRS